jgi:hypothetical protein
MGGNDEGGLRVTLVVGTIESGTSVAMGFSAGTTEGIAEGTAGTTEGTAEGNAWGCGVVGLFVTACVLSIRTT